MGAERVRKALSAPLSYSYAKIKFKFKTPPRIMPPLVIYYGLKMGWGRGVFIVCGLGDLLLVGPASTIL